MAEVALQIGGYTYRLACRDGDEENLGALGATVDSKVRQAQAAVGGASEARQLVMAAILLADELHELRSSATDAVSVEMVEALAQRLESFATKLEQSGNKA